MSAKVSLPFGADGPANPATQVPLAGVWVSRYGQFCS